MENPIIDSYQEEKRKAKKFYASIGSVWCPALGEPVVFTKIGFQHLVWKGKKRRSLSDQRRRFSLLARAKNVVENPNAKIVYRKSETVGLAKRHGERMLLKAPADFWALTEWRGGREITVVIRGSKTKEKHFFSIYDKSKKNQKTVM